MLLHSAFLEARALISRSFALQEDCMHVMVCCLISVLACFDGNLVQRRVL